MRATFLMSAILIIFLPAWVRAGECDIYPFAPLCRPKVSGGEKASDYIRNSDGSMTCHFTNPDIAPCGFLDDFCNAGTQWNKTCNIKIDTSNTGDCSVTWLEPAAGESSPAYVWLQYDDRGDINLVSMFFYTSLIIGGVEVAWDCENSCPPTSGFNLLWTCLHEMGHAIGFYDQSSAYASLTVMAGCSNTPLILDLCCAAFLYPSDPAARLDKFIPVLQGGGVRVKWNSKYEHETYCFYVERRSENGAFLRVSGPIASIGTQEKGADYEYLDSSGGKADFYRLIEVDKAGNEFIVGEEEVATGERDRGESVVISAGELDQLKKDIASEIKKETNCAGCALKASAVGPVEWVAIYPNTFSDAIEGLINYRYYHGLEAIGITYENVVSQYGSINSYLRFLWNTQAHSLKYCLIVGHADVIPIDICNEGTVGDFYAVYDSDAITADLDDDWFPEISMGRIPASTAAEVTAYIAKVLDYEGQAAQSWNDQLTFFIEDRDYTAHSGALSGNLATQLREVLPVTCSIHYLSAMNCVDADMQPCDCSERLLRGRNEFNEGRGLMVAFGSISTYYKVVNWLTTQIASCLFSGSQLHENHKCAFVIGASCDMGNMKGDAYPAIMRELLFATYRGGIALFGPSGDSWQYANYDITASVLNYIYNWGAPSIGYACHRAQEAEMADRLLGNAHTARSYILYGDPAIRLKGSAVGLPPTVTLTAPNGGEYYQSPEVIHIAWELEDNDPQGSRCTVSINYASGSGDWTVLASNIEVDSNGHGSYDYKIPSGTGLYSNCRIQVLAFDACGNEGSDGSNSDFTMKLITKPSGEPIPIDPVSLRAIAPERDYLNTPFPNPFNPSTSFKFGIKQPLSVTLTVYDIKGSVIKVLLRNAPMNAGEYLEQWNGTNEGGARVSSGIYFLQLRAGDFVQTHRMILLR